MVEYIRQHVWLQDVLWCALFFGWIPFVLAYELLFGIDGKWPPSGYDDNFRWN